MKYLLNTTFLLLIIVILVTNSSARTIQILHTNDLHSSLFTAGAPSIGESEKGGWPQVKATMNKLKAEADAQGIETLIFDAGDFYEGSVYSFADEGNAAIEAYQSFNFNATALGNHDWLTGARSMDRMFGICTFPFPVLAANFKVHSDLETLNRTIRPYFKTELRDGTSLAVLGLTTTESFYKWATDIDSRKKDARFKSVNPTARRYLREIRNENDIVIALTHLGVKTDKLLAKNTRGLDLIIGGHSHTLLTEPQYQKDRSGFNVPIVQSGENGKYIGRILLNYGDSEKGKSSKPNILSYKTIEVEHNIAGDPEMQHLIEIASHKLDERYGSNYLNEIIGSSPVRLVSGESGPSAFGRFAAESMITELENVDLAFDFGAFHGGTDQASGPISRKMLMDIYPRRFELDRKMGTNIWTAYVPGWAFKLALSLGANYGLYLATSGLTYDVVSVDKLKNVQGSYTKKQYTRFFATNLKVKGQKIRPFKMYKTALPEAFVRGAFGITPLAGIFLRKHQDTKLSMWDAMFRHLEKIKTIEPLTPDNTWGIVAKSQIKENGTWAEIPWHLEGNDFADFMHDLLSMNDQKDNSKTEIPAKFIDAIKDACEEEKIKLEDCPVHGEELKEGL